MKTKLAAILLATLLPMALACNREQAEVDDPDDTAAQTTDQEVAGVDQPGDLNPVEAQTMVDDVTIGRAVGADGTIAADQQGDDFAPGEPIVIAMKVGDAPAGSVVRIDFYGPGEQKVGDATKTVAAGDQHLDFQAGDTASWPKGDYRADVWVGDEKVNSQQFQIVDRSEAGR